MSRKNSLAIMAIMNTSPKSSTPTAYITWLLAATVKTARPPQCDLAQLVGMSESTMCRIVRRRSRVRYGDERIVRLGRLLGLEPEQCFESADTASCLEEARKAATP